MSETAMRAEARAGRQRRFAALLLAGLVACAGPARAAEGASADDTARYLAGLPVPAGSPLAPLEAEAGWRGHAATFNAAFERVDRNQLSKVRAWSNAHLAGLRRPTLYYFFSGPDYLYANAFFPDAATYVLCGLEPVGAVPDLTKLRKGEASHALRTLQTSIRSLMGVSFFKTIDMKSELRSGPVTGTLPILYAFLARSGKTIADVSLVQLAEDGTVEPESGGKKGAHGARITFSSAGGPAQTLYYFSANLANDGFGKSGIGGLGARLGEGDALVKSASYLMHGGGFSQVRSFLMEKSAAIVQDDTGVPVMLFDRAKWDLKPFGTYVGPISLFAGRGQPKMTELYRKEKAGPLGFGIGYRHRMSESSLLLAVKK